MAPLAPLASSPNPVLAEVTRSGQIESRAPGRHRRRRARTAASSPRRATSSRRATCAPLRSRSSSCRWSRVAPPIASGSRAASWRWPQHLTRDRPAQVAAVESLLARAGLDAGALGCGYQEPRNRESLARVLASGGVDRSAVYNNCSGKHAGDARARREHGGGSGGLPRSRASGASANPRPHRGARRDSARRSALRHRRLQRADPPPLARPGGGCLRAPGRRAPRSGVACGENSRRDGHLIRRCSASPRASTPCSCAPSAIVSSVSSAPRACSAWRSPSPSSGSRSRSRTARRAPWVRWCSRCSCKLGVIAEDELGPLGAQRLVMLKNWRGTPIGEIRPVVSLESGEPAVRGRN